MTNRAALFRAEHVGKPVIRRGRRYIEFDMGGGITRHIATIDPLHYGTDNASEIDTAWTADTGAWQWKMVTNRFQLHARDYLNAGNILEWRHSSGEYVTVQPLALNWVDNVTDSRQQLALPQAVQATASDAVLYWQNGYGTGRHFRYTSHPKRLIKEIIIDAAAYLPAPTVSNPYLELEFIVKKSSSALTYYVNGQAWGENTKVTSGQRIEVRNASGEVLWYFENPTAEDADGNTCPALFQMRRQGASRYCTVRIPKTWVDGAVFPITLDPTFTDGYGGDVTTAKDTTVVAASTDNNYGAQNRFPNVAGATAKGMLEFDLSSIASTATCNSATLYLYHYVASTSNAWTVSVYSIAIGNKDWIEGTKISATAGAGEPCWEALAADGSGGVTTAWADTAGLSTSGTDYEASAIGTFNGDRSDAAGVEYTSSLNTTRVAGWFGATNTNYGILTFCTSGLDSTLCTSDHATTGYHPKLVVDYTSGSTATLTATQAAQTISASAVVTATANATLAATQASDSITAAATTETHGTLTQTQAGDSLSSSIATEAKTTLEQTQAGDSLTASITTEAKASLTATQAGQTISATAAATNGPAASLDATQAGNTLTASITTEAKTTLDITQAGDTLVSVAGVEAKATLEATQAGQTLSASVSAQIESSASLIQTQTGDTVSSSITTTASAVLNVTQNGNTSSSTAYAYTITYARPNADTSAGDWTDQDGGTSNLYATIDETTAEDSDYIRSPETPSEDPVVFALSFISTPTYRLSHTVRYRYGKMPDGATDTLNFTVQLREGYTNEANPGTLIAEWTHSNVSTTLATAEQALTSTQAESISDYSDLFVRMVATTA